MWGNTIIFVLPDEVPVLERVLAKRGADSYFSLQPGDFAWLGTPGQPDRRFVTGGRHVQVLGRIEVSTALRLEAAGRKWAFRLWDWVSEKGVDWRRKDRKYWRDLLEEARATIFLHPSEHGVSHQILEWRHQTRLPARKTAAERYGQEIADWLDLQIAEMEEDLDYCDNERWADLRRRKDVRRYYEQRKRGCCGCQDLVVEHPSGLRFLIGCNYGH
jgi:hypothetical protein